MRDKPKACPQCGSDRVAPILYGLPMLSKELRQDLDAGRVALGGCCIDRDSPAWACVACEHTWGKRGGA